MNVPLLEEYLPGCTQPGFDPHHCKECNPSAQKVKTGGLKTQGDPWLHKEFEVRLDYRPCLFKNSNKN